MYKYTRFRKTKQQWRQIDPQLSQEVRDKIVSWFESKPLKYRLICASLFFYCNRFRNAYQRQDTMAKWANTSTRHVSRILADLEAHGIIASNYRHMTSCLYKLSSFFNDFKVRDSLKHLFMAFSFLPIASLEVRSIAVIKENVRQYNNTHVNVADCRDKNDYDFLFEEHFMKFDEEYDNNYQQYNTHLLFDSAPSAPKRQELAKTSSFPKPDPVTLAPPPVYFSGRPGVIAKQVEELVGKKNETKSNPRAKLWTGHSSGMDADQRRLYRERMEEQRLRAKAGLLNR